MKQIIGKLTNDDFFYAQRDEGTYDDVSIENFRRLALENPRLIMKKLGNKLIEQTEALFKTAKHFLRSINKHFNHVCVKTLIF